MSLPGILAAATIAAQIGYPLVDGGARDVVTMCVVMLGAAACLAHAGAQRGARFAVGLLVTTVGIGLAAEVIGVATGFPFGCYGYAQDRLGPSIAAVPLAVPLAWTAGMYPIWVVAGIVCRRGWTRVLATACAAVGWDLYLDPQMVVDGQWRWCATDAGLPGIDAVPWTNYVGWFIVAAAMAVAFGLLERGARVPRSEAVPVTLFCWTWLGSALAQAVFLPGLDWSAVYGFVGMGVLGAPLLLGALLSPSVDTARGP